jgi:hypothetical protein
MNIASLPLWDWQLGPQCIYCSPWHSCDLGVQGLDTSTPPFLHLRGHTSQSAASTVLLPSPGLWVGGNFMPLGLCTLMMDVCK